MLSLLRNFLNSIALVPSVLALSFLAFAIFLVSVPIAYDNIQVFQFLIIEDPKDIQFIITYVIGGIFTLTIFSYTMVMTVLNRNISNYSPRLNPLLLSEKHHQIVLGFTSGTIIFAIILSIALTNSKSNYFPAIGAALAAIFATISIFLFIYFIHSVSKSVHVNYILNNLYRKTILQLNKRVENYGAITTQETIPELKYSEKCNAIGVLHLYDIKKLSKLAEKYNCKIEVVNYCGDTLLEDDILFNVEKELNQKELHTIRNVFNIGHEVAMNVHEVGFKHLVEVAVKASSPSINDPATASSCIHYLTQLFISRLRVPLNNQKLYLENRKLIIGQIASTVLLKKCFIEMYRYMKDDPLLVMVLKEALDQIQSRVSEKLDFSWKELVDLDTRL